MQKKCPHDNNRIVAEAHLYVAILKADSIVTGRELVETFVQVQKSQKWLNFINTHDELGETVVEYIKTILTNMEYQLWDASKHLEFSIKILTLLKQQGDWTIKLLYDKLESGLKAIAFIDSYDLNESIFVNNCLLQLKTLKEKNQQ